VITFFPDPYPEELLYSVIARYQERVMVINRKTALLDLFGTANALAVINLPSHLGALVSNLPSGNPYSPELLIKRHTLLPYFAPFLERNQLASVMEDMANPLVRVSALAVGRELGCVSWLQKHPGKIPKTMEVISLLAEDRMAFACRRLLHTWNGFDAAGIRPKPWELLREARIRDDMSKHPAILSLIERLGTESGRDEILGASCY
jgi:hypothetical protein